MLTNQCNQPVDNTPLIDYLRYDFSVIIERLISIETKLTLSEDVEKLLSALEEVRIQRVKLANTYQNIAKKNKDATIK